MKDNQALTKLRSVYTCMLLYTTACCHALLSEIQVTGICFVSFGHLLKVIRVSLPFT